MGAVTYPHSQVEKALEKFVSVRLNVADPTDAVKIAMRDARMVWTPTLIWFDHHGIEIRREIGFLEPDHFVGVLKLAEGQADLLHADYDQALAHFDEVSESSHPDVAAEALYWAGVAALRLGSRDDFAARWTRLHETYPRSTWWERASFFAD